MERLIDATRIEQYILNNCSDNEEINAIYAEIINAPTVDAEPVRHGYWIENDNGTYSCSECHSWIPNEQYYYARYCLYCGARMGEVEE